MTAAVNKSPKENTSGSGVYNAAEKRYQFFWGVFFILVSFIAIIQSNKASFTILTHFSLLSPHMASLFQVR